MNTMKRFLICASVVAAALCTNLTAMARNPEKQESRHVIVTLKSGEKSTDTSTAPASNEANRQYLPLPSPTRPVPSRREGESSAGPLRHIRTETRAPFGVKIYLHIHA